MTPGNLDIHIARQTTVLKRIGRRPVSLERSLISRWQPLARRRGEGTKMLMLSGWEHSG